jgi:hypothetical protein
MRYTLDARGDVKQVLDKLEYKAALDLALIHIRLRDAMDIYREAKDMRTERDSV